MFSSIIEINISNDQTFIIPRKKCGNKQLTLDIATAILSIQRNDCEKIEKEGETEIIKICVDNEEKEMKVESTLDKPNTTYLLANTLSKLIKTL